MVKNKKEIQFYPVDPVKIIKEMRMKKHKAGSKRGRDHMAAARQGKRGNGIFMSANLPPHVVKNINRMRKAS